MVVIVNGKLLSVMFNEAMIILIELHKIPSCDEEILPTKMLFITVTNLLLCLVGCIELIIVAYLDSQPDPSSR